MYLLFLSRESVIQMDQLSEHQTFNSITCTPECCFSFYVGQPPPKHYDHSLDERNIPLDQWKRESVNILINGFLTANDHAHNHTISAYSPLLLY